MEVMRIEPNGDVFWKGQLLGNDPAVFRAVGWLSHPAPVGRGLSAETHERAQRPLPAGPIIIGVSGDARYGSSLAFQWHFEDDEQPAFGFTHTGVIRPVDDPQFLMRSLSAWAKSAGA